MDLRSVFAVVESFGSPAPLNNVIKIQGKSISYT